MTDKQQLLDTQDWETIIKQLVIHAHFRMKFWKLLNRGLKGYNAKDIALEAVVAVYTGEWRWDPSKSDLLTYMKYHVVNGLVANLARSKEVRSTDWSDDDVDPEDSFSIEDKVNSEMILSHMLDSIGDDAVGREVFECLYSGMMRKDICAQLNISLGEYDNALRRLRNRLSGLNILYSPKDFKKIKPIA